MDGEESDLADQFDLRVDIDQMKHPGCWRRAVDGMRHKILRATCCDTLVRPLDLFRPHYKSLKVLFQTATDPDLKKDLADMISVLAMDLCEEGQMDSLNFKLKGSADPFFFEEQYNEDSWGRNYVMTLAGQIKDVFANPQDDDLQPGAMKGLMEQIVAFCMKYAEKEAVHILLKVEKGDLLLNHVDYTNYKRVCIHLESFSLDRILALRIAYGIHMKYKDFIQALRIALALHEFEYLKDVYSAAENQVLLMKQFSYIVARHGLWFVIDDTIVRAETDKKALQEIINNHDLSKIYLDFAHYVKIITGMELSMMRQCFKDVYRTVENQLKLFPGRVGHFARNYLNNQSPARFLKTTTIMDSTIDRSRKRQINRYFLRQEDRSIVFIMLWNLAATFQFSFINAGLCQGDYLEPETSNADRLAKNSESGKLCATASLGLQFLWSIDVGRRYLDKYMESTDDCLFAGALLGVGICNSRVNKASIDAMNTLLPHVNEKRKSRIIRIGAIMGLSISHAGSYNEKIKVHLLEIMRDPTSSIEILAFTAIALGLIYVGSCNEEVAISITHALTHRDIVERPVATRPLPCVLLPVALGLLYLGHQELVESRKEFLQLVDESMRKYCDITLLSLAYAGTGAEFKIQELLRQCSLENSGDGEFYKGPAVLGVALVALTKFVDHGRIMQSLEDLLEHGDLITRRAAPLALGVLFMSNPEEKVVRRLQRLIHHVSDRNQRMAAVLAMGFMGAGTNNLLIAKILDEELDYSTTKNEMYHSFAVKFAVAMLRMGRGLLTLSPLHFQGNLLSPTALSGIVIVMHCCLEFENVIPYHYPYMLFHLVSAMQPKMLMTMDENLELLSVPVRNDELCTISPVIMHHYERYELDTEKYVCLSPVLEGVVILKKNPDYVDIVSDNEEGDCNNSVSLGRF